MLKELTLGSLGETAAGEQFEEALATVKASFERDGDVQGPRTISLKLSFTPDNRGYVAADISVAVSTPNRKVKTLAAYEGGILKIDTVTNDAKQPSLLEEGKVTPFRAKGGE